MEITVKLNLPDGVPDKYKEFNLTVEKNSRLSKLDLQYSYAARYSAEDLKKEYIRKVTNLNKNYVDSLNKELGKLQANLPAAIKMDANFGSEKTTTEKEFKGDERSGYNCPILSCGQRVSKARRHIKNKHGHLNEEKQNYAVQMAKLLLKNQTTIEDETPRLKSKRYTCTNLVKRKGNYKECLLCKELFKNMPAHIIDKHNISKVSHTYDQLVRECPVIPKCYIVKEQNRARKMTDAEKLEVDEVQVEIVEQQKSTNHQLKELMSKITDIYKRLQNCTEAESELLAKQRDKLKVEYNELRYKDTRNYPDTLKQWKNSFSSYQKNTKEQKC